jgi:uncharacterized phage protein (TIGR01671 family)
MCEADFFDNFYVINQGRVGIIKGDVFDDGSSFYVDYSDKNNWKVMQYTGLKDMNGKEIFEGDILATRPARDGFRHIDSIELGWSRDDEYGYIWANSKYVLRVQDLIDERYEVIGNIYENPELLQ